MFTLIAQEWSVVSQAPLAFFLLGAGMFGLAYMAARWKFASVIEQVKASNETLKERLHLKSEQAEQYKDRALKFDQKVWEVVESDASELSQKALSLVSEIRAFIDRYRRQDDLIQQNEWQEMAQAKDEAEKSKLWNRYTNASSRSSTERNSEWERRFKVDAILLRDEMLSRLPEYESDKNVAFMYERPTNYFGINDVATDLEKMAKLLLSSNSSLR